MNKLSEFRKLTNLKQGEFSALLNITPGAFSHYETNRRQPPLKIARKIVAILNERGADCSLDTVFPPEN